MGRPRLASRPPYWVAVLLLLAGVGVGSFFLVRQIAGDEPEGAADLGPSWYVPALQEDATKPRITRQTLNGILVGPGDLAPTIDLCEKDPDGASPVPLEAVEARSAVTPVEVAPAYLPEGVYLEMAEAAECADTVVNVVKRYVVPTRENEPRTLIPLWSGGGFFIARTLTAQRQYPVEGAAERLRAATIAGHRAVVLEPVMPLGRDIGITETIIVIADDLGITVIQGDGMPLAEFIKVANSLYQG